MEAEKLKCFLQKTSVNQPFLWLFIILLALLATASSNPPNQFEHGAYMLFVLPFIALISLNS
jgi:hypothetical protein